MKKLICLINTFTNVSNQSKLDQYEGFEIPKNKHEIIGKNRLFLPLNQLWYSLFADGQKEWEMRGMNNIFNSKTVELGRTVEIRKGYQSDPIWGTIKERIIVNSMEEIPKIIYDKIIPPSVQEDPEVIDFINIYNSKYEKFILFRIQIEKN